MLKSWQRVLQLVSIAGVGEQLLLAWNTCASLCKIFVWQGLVKDFIALVGTDPFDVKELLPFSGCVYKRGLARLLYIKMVYETLIYFEVSFFNLIP